MSHLRCSWGIGANNTWVAPTPMLFRLYKAFRHIKIINAILMRYYMFSLRGENINYHECYINLAFIFFAYSVCRKELMSVSEVPNCLEGNTISNRVAYSTKERMHSDRKHPLSLPAWKAVPDWLYISHFAMYCPPGSIRIMDFNPRTSSFHSYVRGY